MFQSDSIRCIAKLTAVLFGMLLPVSAKDEGAKEGVRLRFICIASLAENQEVVLASTDDEGKWHEHGTICLRASSISEWMPAKVGELHLAVKEDEALKSICHFTCPAAAAGVLIVLRPNEGKVAYEAHVVEPEKAGFVKASTLIVNFSHHAALVKLGPDEHKLNAGQELVAKPVLDESGMYRLTASRLDAEEKPVLCYDRSVSGNPDSREMVFLLSHKSRGIRLVSLPLFD